MASRYFAVSVILIAAPWAIAPASAQSSTVCNSVGITTVCNTSPTAPRETPHDAMLRQMQQQRQDQDRRESQAILDQFDRNLAVIDRQAAKERAEILQQIELLVEAQNQEWLKRIGKLVQSGECERAKNAALAQGRFDIAQQAVQLCAPKAPPPAAAPPEAPDQFIIEIEPPKTAKAR